MNEISIKWLKTVYLESLFYSFSSFVNVSKISLVSKIVSLVVVKEYLGEYYEKT